AAQQNDLGAVLLDRGPSFFGQPVTHLLVGQALQIEYRQARATDGGAAWFDAEQGDALLQQWLPAWRGGDDAEARPQRQRIQHGGLHDAHRRRRRRLTDTLDGRM